MKKYYRLILSIFFMLGASFIRPLMSILWDVSGGNMALVYRHTDIFLISGFSWFFIELVHTFKRVLLKRYDLSQEDNLTSRKVYTQINLLEKILIFIIILFATGFILLSFDSIKKIGIGLFASAGLAGIIIGLSAQKVMGTLLAGIQIAITQPFRIDDAVLVEGEWGWIEEINLTYVVVRIWDKRRLVLPSTYFLEKPFQNWTRTTAEITGSVFLYTDYKVPVDMLRAELTRLLNASELWDGKVNNVQVTDARESTMEIRILVSAKNSPTAWDLRVHVREKMIEFLQKNYPESLPRTRIALEGPSQQTKEVLS